MKRTINQTEDELRNEASDIRNDLNDKRRRIEQLYNNNLERRNEACQRIMHSSRRYSEVYQFYTNYMYSVDPNAFIRRFYNNQFIRGVISNMIRSHGNIKIYGVLRTYYEDVENNEVKRLSDKTDVYEMNIQQLQQFGESIILA